MFFYRDTVYLDWFYHEFANAKKCIDSKNNTLQVRSLTQMRGSFLEKAIGPAILCISMIQIFPRSFSQKPRQAETILFSVCPIFM